MKHIICLILFTVLISAPTCETPNFTDTDGDTVLDIFDNCPTVPNRDQIDTNNDGVGDVCQIWSHLIFNSGEAVKSEYDFTSRSFFTFYNTKDKNIGIVKVNADNSGVIEVKKTGVVATLNDFYSNKDGFIFIGSKKNEDIGTAAMWYGKFDLTGSLVWDKMLNATSLGTSITSCDSGYCLAGYNFDNWTNALLVKTDTEGNIDIAFQICTKFAILEA